VAAPLTADEVIAELKLGPHPKGGYYRETFRDPRGQGDQGIALIRRPSSIS
jgi:predicted cupin superfamily sugar epimerase